MAPRLTTASVLIALLVAGPALAAEDQHRRAGGNRQREQGQAAPPSTQRERAVPRTQPRERGRDDRASEERRQQDARRQDETRREDARRQYEAQQRYQAQRDNDARRRAETNRNYDRRDYGSRAPFYAPRYGYRGRVSPRVIRPTIVTVVPYRPYVYRPRLAIDVFYGSGGVYPYGYTPRGYYDPLPGHPYGGLRITGLPRDAQVFADGYYVGIVDDFDGIFQHVNLEAGPHHIEIEVPGGYEPVAFDVIVEPGRTITYRAY